MNECIHVCEASFKNIFHEEAFIKAEYIKMTIAGKILFLK